MKRLTTFCFLSSIIMTFTLQAQITVVGVGSVSTSIAPPEHEKYITIGGSSPSDYKKIGEGLYECIYNYTVSTQDKAGEPVKENYTTILQIGDNAGRFTDYPVYRRDSVTFSNNPDKELWTDLDMQNKKTKYRFTGDILLDYPSGQLTYTDIVTPFYQEYTESYPSIEWNIGEERDTVCGYLCTRATGSYGGREWEVWFAEEIPSQMGPWKFSGLPGLIMKARDTEGIHDFQAISFREGKTPIAKPNNPLIQKTTRDKFIDTKNRFEKNPFSVISSESIKEITVKKDEAYLIINKVEIPRRPNGYTPIELQ
ncbi:MAG: GLPGLI family protein [Paramuribaculum sp.]|nr:GLPGLI family protein [Paramuribaculum sp.]